MIEVSEPFKKSLYGYKNGCVPSNIHNIYNLLDKYYDLFGVFGENNDGDIVFIRGGSYFGYRGKKLNNIDYFRMRVQINKMLDSDPSIYTIKQAVALIAIGGHYRF